MSDYKKVTSTGEVQEGLRVLSSGILLTDNTTLTIADSGQTFNVGTDAKTQTLPTIDAGNLGMKFRFRNVGADGAVKLNISPASTDGINGTVANAAADSVASGVVNKDFANTKATANNGDWIELEAVALTKWYVNGGVGIWASEA
jgi:type II secretory pathway component GspD/PulD (secretin)